MNCSRHGFYKKIFYIKSPTIFPTDHEYLKGNALISWTLHSRGMHWVCSGNAHIQRLKCRTGTTGDIPVNAISSFLPPDVSETRAVISKVRKKLKCQVEAFFLNFIISHCFLLLFRRREDSWGWDRDPSLWRISLGKNPQKDEASNAFASFWC